MDDCSQQEGTTGPGVGSPRLDDEATTFSLFSYFLKLENGCRKMRSMV